jgi:hypothetical protein
MSDLGVGTWDLGLGTWDLTGELGRFINFLFDGLRWPGQSHLVNLFILTKYMTEKHTSAIFSRGTTMTFARPIYEVKSDTLGGALCSFAWA